MNTTRFLQGYMEKVAQSPTTLPASFSNPKSSFLPERWSKEDLILKSPTAPSIPPKMTPPPSEQPTFSSLTPQTISPAIRSLTQKPSWKDFLKQLFSRERFKGTTLNQTGV